MTSDTTTAATVSTIGELNAAMGARPITIGWPGWTLTREYRLGRAGQQNKYRGTAGAKLHLLDVDVVVDKPADARRDSFKVGAYASVTGCVSGNGQFTGTVVESATDLAAVNCIRCRARLDRILAKVTGGAL